MANDSGLVSVYMPTRNRAELACKAIDSVLRQSYKNIEIVVIDDGSDADQFAKLSRYIFNKKNNFDIKIHRNEESKGAPVARNLAIKLSQGEYITGIDDDDEWADNRVENFMSAAKKFGNATPFYSDDYFVNSNGDCLKKWRKPKTIKLEDMLLENKVGNQVFAYKDIWNAVSGFDEKLKVCQDYDMWWRMLCISGVFRNVGSSEQYILIQGADRISRNRKHFHYFSFYRKHRDELSREQRYAHLMILNFSFKSMLLKNWFPALILVNPRTALRMIKKQVKQEWFII
tara:strand:- start:8265 stop:9125 length:861 start_codon:yes stop_codon:yes gene_type:complete